MACPWCIYLVHTWHLTFCMDHREKACITPSLTSGSNCRGIPKTVVSQVKYHSLLHVSMQRAFITNKSLIDCDACDRFDWRRCLLTIRTMHRLRHALIEFERLYDSNITQKGKRVWYRSYRKSMTIVLDASCLFDIHARPRQTGESLPLSSRSITPFLQAQSRQTFHFLASFWIWPFSRLISHCRSQNGVSLTLRIILRK